MSTTREPESLERELLSALCASGMPVDERERILAQLAKHEWRSPDHRVLFVALGRSRQRGGIDSTALREFLVAEVTRLGFPDFDLTSFFVSTQLDPKEMAQIADALLACGRPSANRTTSPVPRQPAGKPSSER